MERLWIRTKDHLLNIDQTIEVSVHGGAVLAMTVDGKSHNVYVGDPRIAQQIFTALAQRVGTNVEQLLEPKVAETV